MERLKELEDRPLRPVIVKSTAKAFIRNALFDPSKSSASEEVVVSLSLIIP
jgi:hypothetical protein